MVKRPQDLRGFALTDGGECAEELEEQRAEAAFAPVEAGSLAIAWPTTPDVRCGGPYAGLGYTCIM